MPQLVMFFIWLGAPVVRGFRRLFWPLTTAKRWALMATLVVLAGLFLLFPVARHGVASFTAHPAADYDAEITDYTADYRVAPDGRLTATERITVALPADRHGIFRFFPVDHPADPHVRAVPTITAVTRDGQPVPVDGSWQDDRSVYVVKIGDPHTVLPPGTYTYTLNYQLPGVLTGPQPGELTGGHNTAVGQNPAAPTATFFHNVVGFWAMPIRTARVTVELPGPSGLVQCSAGWWPYCTLDGAGTDRLTVTVEDLPRQTPVTLRADLQVPMPQQHRLPWSVRYDSVLGRSLPNLALVGLLSLLASGGGYLWMRSAREPSPGFPVCYVPPRGLGPAQTVYLAEESVGEHALVATLLYLAERGLVRLEIEPFGRRHWRVTGLVDPPRWQRIDPISRRVGETLGITTAGATFVADDGPDRGAALVKATEDLSSDCAAWARSGGLAVSSAGERVGRVAVFGALALAGLGFLGLVGPSMWGLPFAAFAVGGVGLLGTGVGTRRTPAGRYWWSQAAGFRRLLATPSSADRFDFAARRDLYVAYIPYAVGFGVAETWASKYRMATGWEPPIPVWYPIYSSTGRPAPLYSALNSFSSAVSASVSGYRQAMSASAGSGMSWGRGGGGGGGTW